MSHYCCKRCNLRYDCCTCPSTPETTARTKYYCIDKDALEVVDSQEYKKRVSHYDYMMAPLFSYRNAACFELYNMLIAEQISLQKKMDKVQAAIEEMQKVGVDNGN